MPRWGEAAQRTNCCSQWRLQLSEKWRSRSSNRIDCTTGSSRTGQNSVRRQKAVHVRNEHGARMVLGREDSGTEGIRCRATITRAAEKNAADLCPVRESNEIRRGGQVWKSGRGEETSRAGCGGKPRRQRDRRD